MPGKPQKTKGNAVDGIFNSLRADGKFCVVADFARKHREAAQQRLARIANGADPRYTNGKELLAEYQLPKD